MKKNSDIKNMSSAIVITVFLLLVSCSAFVVPNTEISNMPLISEASEETYTVGNNPSVQKYESITNEVLGTGGLDDPPHPVPPNYEDNQWWTHYTYGVEYFTFEQYFQYIETLAYTPNSINDEDMDYYEFSQSGYNNRGDGIIVAVIDTGIDFDHPDLAGRIWVNPGEDLNGDGIFDENEVNGIDDDGNGVIDDGMGFNFYNSELNQNLLLENTCYTFPNGEPSCMP